jgi:hypothetical protein
VGACLCAAEFVDYVDISGVVSSIEEEHELEFGAVGIWPRCEFGQYSKMLFGYTI